MMTVVTGAGEAADQESPSLAEVVFHGCHVTVLIVAGGPASLDVVFLEEVAAKNRVATDFERQILQEVRSELDIAFGRSEEPIESGIRLRGAGPAVIAEVGGQTFANQRAAIFHEFTKTLDGRGLQHNRIGQVNNLVLRD